MVVSQCRIRHVDSLRRRQRSTPPATLSATFFRLRPRLEVMEDRTLLSTFVVSNTGDIGPGSLRQAILDSNNAAGATNTIDFDISGTGVQTIVPLSSLPAISNPLLIDGTSEPGYGRTPLISLSGSLAGTGDGLTITAAGVTVRGLDINNFNGGAGIHITGTSATGDWIYGNFLGTDPTGTQAGPNYAGVEIDAGAANNLIGTNGDGVNDAAERNLISGNLFAGIWVNGKGTDGNAVAGDFIGASVTGDVALDNGTAPAYDSYGDITGGGIVIEGGAHGNRIGTDGGSVDDAGERNIIAGSGNDGIDIVGAGTDANIVAGNFIGTDVTGTHALGIPYDGVLLAAGASFNWIGVNPIGGTAVGDEGNVISGTGYDGVQIYFDSGDNGVAGDKIGTDATGAVALGNSKDGVEIVLSSGNTIGGTTAAAGNIIANNGSGVVVGDYAADVSSIGNQVTANRIFGNKEQAIDLGDDGVTYNATSPRKGSNNLQNFPIIVTNASGQLQGWLGGSTPDTSFHIDVFASADYGPGGSGEAEDYLGSLTVTTDATGEATFAVPFTAPAGLPIVTATATDPQGNTSEVTSPLAGSFQAQSQFVRLALGQKSLALSPASGHGIALEDPGASSELMWDLSLSVSAGTLTLPSIAGLVGLGDGTGSLLYSGTLAALNAAMQGMTYSPPAGLQGIATLSVEAQSDAIILIAGQVTIFVTSGQFDVTTTADSGPGSLRRAILESNLAMGGANTINFAIPGTGVETIAPDSPLPAITNPVVIDGTTQPGYAGAPLITIVGQGTGGPGPLTVGSNVTVKGLAIGGSSFSNASASTMLAVESVPLPQAAGGTVSYQIVVAGGEDLVATAQAVGTTTSLSLLDAQGHIVMQSDGLSAAEPIDAIDTGIARGTYSLQVHDTGGKGSFTLTITMLPATPFQPIPVTNPYGPMVAGDFNNDGQLDLAIAGPSDAISIMLGNGDGTFQPPVTYAVGSYPGGIVAGDFTGDGHLDLAFSDGAGIQVLLGDGDGTFQPAETVAAGIGGALVAGDFNRDGRLDLAVANRNYGGPGSVSVLLGNGDGTFQPQVTYAVGISPGAIVAGDFTGDGRLDLAVACTGPFPAYQGSVSVLLGNGDGTFQPAVQYAAGADPRSIVAGDFTGNGRLDLAVADDGSYGAATGYGTVLVLLSNADGTFQPPVSYAVGAGPYAIVAADLNGDGRIDLAVTDVNTDDVSILLGNGDGTFQPAQRYTVGSSELGPYCIVAGDFTGDGRIDLAVTYSKPGTYGGELSVLLGNGDGTFQTDTENAVTGPFDIVAGDFAGDGKLDLAVNDSAGVQMLLGNGDGTFQPARTVAAGIHGFFAAGDFNGDGRLDLAVVSSDVYTNDGAVSILLGNGDGTFQPPVIYAVGLAPHAIVAGNFTGDGRLDLAVANFFSNDVSILLGNGDGTFQPAVEYPVGAEPDGIVACDFTGDGKLDLAVANVNYYVLGQIHNTNSFEPGSVSVLLGNGDGTFQPQVTYAVGTNPTSVVAGDFTGNGHLDLAVSDDDGIQILQGDGDGKFQTAKTVQAGISGALVAGDFNGDGKLDLAVAGSNYNYSTQTYVGEVSVLLGDGDGTFRLASSYSYPNDQLMTLAGDFNGDGRSDLAVPDYASSDISVLLSNGDGTFVDPGQLATTPHATPLVADVTGNGTDDVLVVDGAGNILYRQGIPGQPGAFEPPVTVNPNNPSRDIAWLPNTDQGPVLASVDAHDNAISFYAYRDGRFVRLIGSLPTGRLPAQIIAADLTGDGLTDLVVRNAGDGTLSVYFGTTLSNIKFIGPVSSLDPPTFLPQVTLAVGLGVSDVQAVDTTGSGALDLVVTNKLTAQVSVLRNQGNGTFAAPVPYRAGTGLSAIDPGSTPEVTSLDAPAGVAAGSFTTGGPTSLVTINPGSKTLGVLAGLGQGRFANPVALYTGNLAQVVRVADFTGNGVGDLAVLTANGLSIYLGNGQGGFLPPTTYAVPPESDGLTVSDLLGNGTLDLLVGDAYGDVLVLLGNGNGTFQPYHEANQAVELAVADLTGNGSKDIIYADQGLDRVVVDYGAGNSSVLANQSTGLLDPGAVKLADLNGDGIPDLIVANSGSNNVLIYPGLGDGQFGPSINGGNGYFVGDNPVGITVANLTGPLPDLVVADKGSNEVSILLNQSQKAGPISFEAGPRLNAGGSGPVSTVVGNFTGGAFPDMLVTNSQSNDVVLLSGVGQGFFNDQNPRIYSVGIDPGPTFVGSFNGQTDLVTVNAGSNDLTLISGFEGTNPTTSTITSGGVLPDSAFAFGSGGFEDLVVGNGGDGALALFEGGASGLSLTSVENEPNLPDPTALAFSALTGGQVQFYAATAGRESAELVALSLGIETATISSSTATSSANPVAQLVPLSESSLPLVATVLTLTIAAPGEELNVGLVETETTAVAAFLPGTGVSVGQGLALEGHGGSGPDDGGESDVSGANVAGAVPAAIAPWQRYVIGQDEALEQFRRENPNGVSGAPARDSASDRPDSPPAAGVPIQGRPSRLKSGSNQAPSGGETDRTEEPSPTTGVEAVDMVISSLWGEDRASDCPGRLSHTGRPSNRSHDSLPRIRLVVSPSPDQGPRNKEQGTSVLPRGREPGKDEPDLALTSLLVATMATEWVRACRWHRTARPGRPGRVGNPVLRRRVVIK